MSEVPTADFLGSFSGAVFSRPDIRSAKYPANLSIVSLTGNCWTVWLQYREYWSTNEILLTERMV